MYDQGPLGPRALNKVSARPRQPGGRHAVILLGDSRTLAASIEDRRPSPATSPPAIPRSKRLRQFVIEGRPAGYMVPHVSPRNCPRKLHQRALHIDDLIAPSEVA